MGQRQRNIVSELSVIKLFIDVEFEVLDKLFAGVRFLDNGCWVRGEDSTISTQIDGKRAHRISYELFTGKRLKFNGIHTCGSKACINPEHIVDKKSTMRQINNSKIPLTFYSPSWRSDLGNVT
jgi:hypothetical protein